MLRNLNIDEILFLDIETVPLAPEYEELTDKWQSSGNTKCNFR